MAFIHLHEQSQRQKTRQVVILYVLGHRPVGHGLPGDHGRSAAVRLDPTTH